MYNKTGTTLIDHVLKRVFYEFDLKCKGSKAKINGWDSISK